MALAAVVAWIGEMLLTVVGRLAIQALISLGIGFAINSLGSAVGDFTHIQEVLANAGPLYGYIGFFGLDTAITIVLSALAGREITQAVSAHLTSNFNPKLKR